MNRPAEFQFAIDQVTKHGFMPNNPSEYLGIYGYFMWTTYGFPVEMTQEDIEKTPQAWMSWAALKLLCLRYVLKHGLN